MPISGKDVIKILLKRGWKIKNQRGSHVKMAKDRKIIPIPVHGNRDLPMGLIRAIEKQTGEKLI